MAAANQWCLDADEAVQARMAHVTDNQKGAEIEVKPFSGSGSRRTIYEFFAAFDIKYEGTDPERKAVILYDSLLEGHAKTIARHVSTDYQRMRAELLKAFGAPRAMCRSLLDSMRATKQPSNYGDAYSYPYYAELQNMIAVSYTHLTLPTICSV